VLYFYQMREASGPG